MDFVRKDRIRNKFVELSRTHVPGRIRRQLDRLHRTLDPQRYALMRVRSKRWHRLAVMCLLLLLCAAFLVPDMFTPTTNEAGIRTIDTDEVADILETPPAAADWKVFFPHRLHRATLQTAFQDFYGQRDNAPAWITEDGDIAALDSLIEVLSEADLHGLDKDAYHVDRLEKLRMQALTQNQPAQFAELDRLATASYLLYAAHQRWGRIDVSQMDTLWRTAPQPLDLAENLNTTLAGRKLRRNLAELQPKTAGFSYSALQKQYAALLQLSKQKGWPAVDTKKLLHYGDTGRAVAQLKQRLAAEGDLDTAQADWHLPVFDKETEKAAKQYQQRYGLATTGTLTPETRQALAVPLSERLRQIAVNLERMRWLSRTDLERSIWINIPEYRLRVWQRGKPVWETPVVVGDPEHPTPMLEDTLEHVVFKPEWNVPQNIAVKEMLPILRDRIHVFERDNFAVYESWDDEAPEVDVLAVNWDSLAGLPPESFSYRITQRPGPANSLGMVKFLLPNEFDVYLHDTPAKHLFANAYRASSHGCIRVHHPDQLAAVLLRDEGMSLETIQEKMIPPAADDTVGLGDSSPSEEMDLTRPVAVKTVYLTAFVQNNRLHFRPDVYGHDPRHAEALKTVAAGRAQPVQKRRQPLPPVKTRTKKSGLKATKPSPGKGDADKPRRWFQFWKSKD